jgi:hypothetical protein
MAGMLVIFKRTRPATTTAWYTPSAGLETALTAEKLASHASQVELNSGLTQIRTVYFPSAADYNAWNASAGLAAIVTERTAYHTAHNITEVKEVAVLSTV